MAGERKKDCKKINLCQMNGNEKNLYVDGRAIRIEVFLFLNFPCSRCGEGYYPNEKRGRSCCRPGNQQPP